MPSKEAFDIFIVESPLQLLNAIEANNYLSKGGKQKRTLLILCYSLNEKGNDQLKLLKGLIKWDEIIEVTYKSKFDFFKIFFSLRNDIKTLTARNIFIGEFRAPWMHVLSENILHEEKFLLDDGAGTPARQENDLNLEIPSMFYEGEGNNLNVIVKKVYLKLLGLKYLQWKNQINLFTVFDLEAYDGQKIVRNNYEYLRKSCEKTGQKTINEVAFIGTALVEAGIVSNSYYLCCLEKVASLYGGYNVVYIPHRRESNDKLNEIHDRFGYEIRHFNYLIEYEFIISSTLPYKIICFPTMAAITLNRLFPSIEIEMIKLASQNIKEKYRKGTLKNYALYKDIVNIVDF